MEILLTPEIAAALTEQARRQGTTPEQLALTALRERFVIPTPSDGPAEGQATLADYLADHLGVLSSSEQVPGGAQMSQDIGRKFAAGMAEKRWQGRL
jgi:hypothetical protein